jgi:DNA-binding MarR family transcriptional regulator
VRTDGCVQELEELGLVAVEGDPKDRRAWLVSLTPEGVAESHRLYDVGLDRFALFVAEWAPEEIRQLTALLEKFDRSKAEVAERERPAPLPRRRRSV